MNIQMLSQWNIIIEIGITNRTLRGRWSRMNPHVQEQIRFRFKLRITFRAFKGPIFAMHYHMPSQFGDSKRLVFALTTFKTSVIRMLWHNVYFQKTVGRFIYPTLFTHILIFMNFLVALMRKACQEFFITHSVGTCRVRRCVVADVWTYMICVLF